jgi:dipeptidyl aminopeptidase/acylaminoacyl peptidase
MNTARTLPLLLALAPGLSAQDKRPLTLDAFYQIPRVADPQVSPDGKWVVHTVGRVDMAANKTVSQLWLVATAGGEPRQLTWHPSGAREGRWSPDGQWIAFVSSRSGAPQIWKLPLAGGEPVQVTKLSTGAAGIVWSPDGKNIACTSEVWPDLKDDAAQAARAEEREKSKVKAQLIDGLMYRHWDSWREGKRAHTFVVDLATGAATDVSPGEADAPPILHGGPDCYAFSPDGRQLAFTRGPEKATEAISTNADLWLLDLQGNERKNLTANRKGWDGGPVWTSDGKAILFRTMERDGYEADRMRAMRLVLDGLKLEPLAEDLDRNMEQILVSKDGSGGLALVLEDQATRAVEVLGADGLRRRVLSGKNVSGFSTDARTQTIVGLYTALDRPAEVCVVETGKPDTIRALTTHTKAAMDALELPGCESVTYEGALGAKVQGWLVKPPRFDKKQKHPLLLWIHGGPQGAWMDAWHWRWNPVLHAAHGFVVFCPNPHGSTGFGQAFCEQISGDWGGAVYEDLMKGVDLLVAQGFIDEKKIGAAGGSYGGYMVNWMLGHTDRFAALASHAGVYNLESMAGVTEELWFSEWEHGGPPWEDRKQSHRQFSPHRFASQFKTPTLVIHGELDFRVPVGEGMQLYTALQRQGVPSRFLYFPDEGHWIQKPQNSRLWNQTLIDWFTQHLKK